MILAGLSILLTLSAVSPGLSTSDATENEYEVVLRVHDVSCFTRGEASPSAALSLLPFPFSNDSDGIDEEGEWGRTMEPDELASLLAEVPSTSVWDEDDRLSIGFVDDVSRKLFVRAPADMQRGVEDLLQFLRSNCVPTEQLEIRVLAPAGSGGAARLDLASLPPFVPNADSAELAAVLGQLAGAPLDVVAAAGPVRLRDLLTVRFEAGETQNVLNRWESEVAQQAYIGAPIIQEIFAGLTAVVRSAPATGGTYLELALRQSAHQSRPQRKDLPVEALTTHSNGTRAVDIVGSYDAIRMRFASVVSSLLIPENQTALVPVTATCASGEFQYLIALSVRGRVRPVHATFPFRVGPQARRFEVVHTGALTSTGTEQWSLPNHLLDRHDDHEGMQFAAHLGVAGEALFDFGWLEAMVSDLLGEGDLWTDLDSVRGMGECLLTNLDSAGSDAVRRLGLAEQALTSFRVDVEVLRPDGEVAVRCRTLTLADRRASLWAGFQSSVLAGWEVDVANNVAGGRPVFSSDVDGLALRFEVSEDATGGQPRLFVSVNGLVRLLQRPAVPQDIGSPATPFFDRSTADVLHVDDSRLVGDGDTMTWNHQGLELRVRVSRLAGAQK